MIRISPRAVPVLLLGFLLVAPPAFGQRVARHEGYWISFGLGGGSAVGDDAFDGDSKFGGAFFLRMGGSPSQRLLICGEISGWATDKDDVEIARGATLFTALYYPSEAGGLYVKGGAGFAVRTAERTVLAPELPPGEFGTVTFSEDDSGIGLGAGLGYDIQLARNFFLTPALDLVYTGTEGDGASLLLFTVGATWH